MCIEQAAVLLWHFLVITGEMYIDFRLLVKLYAAGVQTRSSGVKLIN